jgi:hypothetical protein
MTWDIDKPLDSFPLSFHQSLALLPKGSCRVQQHFLGVASTKPGIKRIRQQYSLFRAIVRLHGTPEQKEILAKMLFRTKISFDTYPQSLQRQPTTYELWVAAERNGLVDMHKELVQKHFKGFAENT